MSDSRDERLAYIANRIRLIYVGLVDACEALPLPITLPKGSDVTNVEAIPAVRRVAEISEEEPMPEEQRAQLFTAAIMWLMAMDLYGLLVRFDYADARADGAQAALMLAHDAVTDLGAWLLNE
ncbi:hypothetical protein [Streptomyces sp. PR69]|uniref:hypothetical protein n=1 Tax=Streptomyces sp. PR69 TaxID=2984950 RepID=UPI0022641C52|nr:hypothetical protein [Streptomyces sp. PR69]